LTDFPGTGVPVALLTIELVAGISNAMLSQKTYQDVSSKLIETSSCILTPGLGDTKAHIKAEDWDSDMP
jgi:hypothetical protein